MIYDDIKAFNKQFAWMPHIENATVLEKRRSSKTLESRRGWPSGFVVVGMGGSHLAGDLIKTWRPDFPVVVWSNYGLPPLSSEELKARLIIVTSYSGNTEETIDTFKLALKKRLNVAVIASGGKLIAMARNVRVPYTLVPSGVQPRMALGYLLLATLTVMDERQVLCELRALARTFRPSRYEQKGRDFARKLKESIPLLYASSRNYAVAYNWKIRLNETGKIPAFYNCVPEMNHNEISSFDAGGGSAPGEGTHSRIRKLSQNFCFIFLTDADDHPRIIKRMRVMRRIFTKRGFRVETLPLRGKNAWQKMFSSIVLADWTAYYTAQQYHADPEAVPTIEEFKNLIAN